MCAKKRSERCHNAEDCAKTQPLQWWEQIALISPCPNRICIHRKVLKFCLHFPQLICFIIFIFINLVDAFMHSVLQISSQIYPQILHGKHLQIPSGPSNHLSYLLSLLLTQFLSLSLVISNSVFRWRPMLKSRKLTHFSLYTVWHKLSSDNAVRVEKNTSLYLVKVLHNWLWYCVAYDHGEFI